LRIGSDGGRSDEHGDEKSAHDAADYTRTR
jgi:hypothetical protein